jgi:hypothetical protein
MVEASGYGVLKAWAEPFIDSTRGITRSIAYMKAVKTGEPKPEYEADVYRCSRKLTESYAPSKTYGFQHGMNSKKFAADNS